MTAQTPSARPTVRLLPGRHKRARAGHPWVYSNEIDMSAETKALAPGSLVRLDPHEGAALGVATFNPHSLIAARILAQDPETPIDREFFAARLGRALALRARLFDEPFYRLVHAEGDGLPGLVVDRYGDVLVCQSGSAGMDRLAEGWLAALRELLKPRAVVLRNVAASRALEGLESETSVVHGTLDAPVALREGGLTFYADVLEGQKTGWFYDQRESRRWLARLAKDRKILDLYTYSGGFAIRCAAAGAARVLAIDRSEPALALAERAASEGGVEAVCKFQRGEVFRALLDLRDAGERFDIVIADPPAFVKSKKDLRAGAKGYRKLARRAAALVAEGGLLFVASCSHHMDREHFREQVRRGLAEAGRTGRILREAGAGPDHPVHPALPESNYLKSLLLALD